MPRGARPALQQRSRETRDRLLDALERLLRSRDFEDLSVADVAAEAGVSPGAIYRRFEGGLLQVLLELCWATIEARVHDADDDADILSSAGLREALHKVSLSMWRQASEGAHIFRAAYVHTRLRPGLVGEPRRDLEERSLAGFHTVLESFRSEVKRADFERAAATITAFFNTIFLERALFPDRLPRWSKFDDESYAREMAEMAYGYLTTTEPKTKPTAASVSAFIDAVENETRRKDAKTLLALMKRVTGEKAVMWGPSIIGFGKRRYAYASGREGDMPIAGFSPRKANLAVYLASSLPEREALLARLGKHKTGVACLYVNKLADVDMAVLEELIAKSVAHARIMPETSGY